MASRFFHNTDFPPRIVSKGEREGGVVGRIHLKKESNNRLKLNFACSIIDIY